MPRANKPSRSRDDPRRLRLLVLPSGEWELVWPFVSLAGSREGAGWGEFIGLLVGAFGCPFPSLSAGGGVRASALTGGNVIDPDSSRIKRHETQVAVQTHSRGQIADPRIVKV